MLCNLLFLPMYCEGGGILVWKAEYNFVRIIGDLLMAESTLSLWVTHMTIGVFIPSVIMLATSLTRMRWLYSLSNVIGILVWFFNFFRYAFRNGLVGMFDINRTDISIGSWLALLLFLISALVLLFTKPRAEQTADTDRETNRRCPYCGIRLRGNIRRCPRCNNTLT